MKTVFKHLDEVCSALYQDKSDKDLVLLAQEGNKKAILELINRYRPLIISYGRRQHTLALGKEEVIQELIRLFIQAIKAYHVKGTVPFAGFALSTIKYGHWNLFHKVRRIWQHEILPFFQAVDGSEANFSKQVGDIQSTSYPLTSGSYLTTKNQAISLDKRDRGLSYHTSSVEDAVIQAFCQTDMNHRLIEALRGLKKREKELLYAIYFKGQSLADYARQEGCTRQNINYRHQKILQHLREQVKGPTKPINSEIR